MINITSLKKSYSGETVLDIPELNIGRSECFGLVGNNGAGKTTMFRLILDLIRPDSGRVLLDGSPVQNNEEWKNWVGAYLDEHMLLDYLTPDEYFQTLRKIYRLSNEDISQLLSKFDVLFNGEVLNKKKYIRDLSKGNIKKVGIAAAFLGNPSVILLDEPFENLDPSSQVRLKKLIKAEQEESNTTFLISSHDLSHVTDICERIVLLEKGKIIQDLHDSKEAMIESLDSYFEA